MLQRELDECNLRYKTIVEADVHTAIIAIKGNPKFAESAVVDAGIEASICQGGFPEGQSPLTDSTQKMVKICDVTRAIVRMLLWILFKCIKITITRILVEAVILLEKYVMEVIIKLIKPSI